MQRLLPAALLLLAGSSWALVPPQPSATHAVRLNGHTFTLPAGFTIELAAGPPLVDRPIVADFDEQGRLYVADSSGSNEKVAVQLEKRPHRILRLDDADGDGRFDRRTVFADRMMFPEGALWLDGALYVAAPPSIWKLTDTNGDGVVDQRSEWFQGKTLTGCANDLHGPYAGPDGWVYWCKGAFASQTYERPGRPPFTTRAAHIFRCRPDGSGLEPVMTGGMDNPVEVVFTPGGERIFTTTFFQHPAGGRRDGLVHAVYGGVYGKDHNPVYEHKWTSPALLPVLTHLGPAAPAGLTRYDSSVFGPNYQDNLFAACFNLHKVTRHVLENDGSSFRTRDSDFLVSDNLDFHPTDVLADADGSLLVVDTGGWYKLCCPTSQLHKPDILGAVYRIRRTGAPRVADPRGLRLTWPRLSAEELAGLLGDPRPAVRRRAVATLARKGAEAIPALTAALRPDRSVPSRRNAVWTATRIDHPSARALVRVALADADETVRQAALHSISLHRDRAAVKDLLPLLDAPSMHNRRAAAEALGRIGDRAAVPALLRAAGRPADRMLEHSLTYALIEIGDRTGTAAGLKSANLRTRRAALVALDQMDGGGLTPPVVAAELGSPDPALKETAWWVVSRHPEWGTALADVLRDRLARQGMPPAERDELARLLARFARTPAVQGFLAERLRDPAAPREVRRIVLRAMAQAGLRQTPAVWLTALTHTLTGNDRALLGEAVATARALHLPPRGQPELTAALLRIGTSAGADGGLRVQALAALPGGPGRVEPGLFAFLRSLLALDRPVSVRTQAADVLGRAQLTSAQLLDLAGDVGSAGPMERDRLLEAFARCADEQVGRRLVAVLQGETVRPGLRAETVRRCLAKFGPPVQKQAAALYAALDADARQQKVRLEQLLGALKQGDIRRGQAVFNSTKAACSSCHSIGYLGGKVGPDLTHIGKVRSERDLLEAIVFPSASFVRSYEPVLISTRNGKVFNGLLRRDTPDEVVLTTGATEEVRIARADVEEMQPGKVSIMPAGLDQQLRPQDLADLIAFLRACQ